MFHGNIEKITTDNTNYRKVIYTGKHMQLVVMSLNPSENIPKEIHDGHDQFIRIEDGECKIIISEESFILKKDDAIIIPAGTIHEVINISKEKNLKLYTIYSPPEHPPGTLQKSKTKQEGGNCDREFSQLGETYLDKYLNYKKMNEFITKSINKHLSKK